MAANSPKKTSSPLPIIAILALLGGAYYATSQLKSSRPAAPTGMTHAMSEKGKIDARLWQDPLKVTCEHERTSHAKEKSKGKNYVFRLKPEPLFELERPIYATEISESESNVNESSTEHSISQVTERISFINESPIKTVHILLIMIRDDITAEDHERRLRNRYATVTALYSSGFVPEDPMHIKYFRLPWIDKNELEKVHKYTKIPTIKKIVEDPNYTSEPLIVPYEWFKQEEIYLSQTENGGADHVLLVWLPEGAFSHLPLTRLAQVIDVLGQCPNSIDLIGPSRSGTLRTILSEVVTINNSREPVKDSNCVDVHEMLNWLTIFSPWSTTSPALLVNKEEWSRHDPNIYLKSDMYKVIPDEFKKIGVKFIRMIGSDDLLALELINELKRRGVDVVGKKHHVALISEWDTFYGNAFPLTFTTMMESIDPYNGQPKNWPDYITNLNQRNQIRDSNFPENLHIYSYIRGIDGRIPESESSKEEKLNEKSEESPKLTFTKGLELPVGRSQLDYIRRFTQKLSEKYEYFGNNKLKAIGVVGSDVYDKLVLLQALREQFRDMVIFTIDIDARMVHHEQLKWTRNVIVASNYGLELSDSYQSKIFKSREDSLPPFRDNYQTSLFLACRTALTPGQDNGVLYRDMSRKKLTQIISHPQLFEIGRGRPVNLTVSGNKDVIGIHPPRIRRWDLGTLGNQMILIMLAIICFILLVNQISPNVKRWDRKSTGLKLLVLGVIGFIWIVIYDHYREGGEPFSLSTGVSIWPGEILRFIAIILGVFLLVRLKNKLQESEEKLAKEFRLERQESETKRQRENLWKRIESRFTRKRLKKYCDWVLSLDWMPAETVFVDAQEVWNDYLAKGKTFNRIRRLVPMVIGYLVLSGVLIHMFGLPNTPFRGDVSLKVNQSILFLSGIYMIILIFFVVDATHISRRLTGPLIKIRTKWPDGTMENLEVGPDIKSEDFAEVLDVRFVTQLTEDIGKMIYWPFIVLAVMVAARFPYFDNWNFPISLIIAYAIASIFLFICAVNLQSDAKRVRSKALNNLNRRLFEARFGKSENRKRALKLTYMIREIESIREGAFRPFYENPVIHVIFGSGGAGLLALLKYMPL